MFKEVSRDFLPSLDPGHEPTNFKLLNEPKIDDADQRSIWKYLYFLLLLINFMEKKQNNKWGEKNKLGNSEKNGQRSSAHSPVQVKNQEVLGGHK